MKKFLLWALIATMTISLLSLGILSAAAAETQTGSCGDSVTWTLNPDTGELVISGQGPMTDYAITNMTPWIASCTAITSVRVEEGVTSLGAYAFLYCSNLATVSLPESLTSIGAHSFSNCSKLTDLQIPAGVRQIGAGAFQNCASLTELVIPEGVTEILGSTFSGCSKLAHVELPDSVTSIGSSAFASCSALTDIRLPTGLSVIDSKAFTYCSSLKTITLPGTLTALGDGVFTNSALQRALFDGAQDEWDNVTVGESNALLTSVLLIHPGHLFNQEIVDPAYLCTPAGCVSAASYYRTCVCGEVGDETFSHGEPIGHTGGTATCRDQAICEVCGEAYGILGSHVPNREATCTEGFSCAICEIPLKDPLGHDYVPTVTPPTCTEPGFTAHVCSRCNDTFTDTPTDPTGHTEGAAPTCTEDQICTVCHEILAEKLGHNHIPEITLAPTCTDSGIRTHTCSRCNDTYDETIDATGHIESDPASCETAQTCTACGLLLADALGHDFHAETVEPTCTAKGYTVHTCSRCAYTYHDSLVDAKGHAPVGEATCTEPQLCGACGGVLTEALGHDYTSTVTEPTCTEQGFTIHSCDRCGHAYRDTFTDAAGHTPGEEATCTVSQLCTVCGEVLTEASGHSYTQAVTEPSCTEQGFTTHTCSACGHTYRDTFTTASGHTPDGEATCAHAQLCTVCGELLAEALGHDYTHTVTAPTCTEQGFTTHTCSACGYTYLDTFTDAKAHVPGDAATCSRAQVCTVCGEVLTPAQDHDYTHIIIAPTCTTRGYTTHTCSRCNHTYLDAFTETAPHTIRQDASCYEPQSCSVCGGLIKEATGHDYRTTTVEATCNSQGYVKHVCIHCSASYLDNFTPAKGHTPGEAATCTQPQTCTVCQGILTPAKGHSFGAAVTAPTCTESGYTTHACANCEATYVDTPTEPAGHVPGKEASCHAPQTCTVCQAILAERLEHTYEEARNEPTCTIDGQILDVCSLCGDSYVRAFIPAVGHTVGDWVLENAPDVGEPGRKHKSCEVCSEMVEHETFWTPDAPGPSDESGSVSETVTEPETEEEEGGCRITGGNIAVIVIVIIALGLLWFVDMRRR